MFSAPRLKEIFREHGFRPLKRLGENYLIDSNIKDKIISETRISAADTILEIGPGFGAVTFDLASSGAGVVAVEKDKKAFAILGGMASGAPNLRLVLGDILEFDIEGIKGSPRIKVVGNLPYYITTPIIERLISSKKSISSAVLMVQKEVAGRMLACPGNKDYGSLSCFVQYHTIPAYVYTVKRTSFYPAPDVDSALIRLDMPAAPTVEVKNEGLLFRIIRGAFNQRRKSIINSLSREAVLDMPKESLSRILESLHIDPSVRAEMLSLLDFARLANAL